MCDLDHFKKVNDTFGHQAGDKALVTFAALLKKYCRHGDLVARYGGEEFVMLCSDCDNATATQRAEAIRRAWAARPHPTLDGGSLTASFGVTELQAGDTAETVLRRADRALLQAKDNGRNLVVQLGSGMSADRPAVERSRSWFGWLQQKPAGQILERTLVSSVPLKLAAEKLRGFVADHAAEILEVRDNRIALQVDGAELNPARRTNDRPTPFLIDMEFADLPWPEKVQSQRDTRTRVRIVIRPKRQRDRRQDATEERARQLLMSVKAYLMAEDWRENS
jgi:diguanylate cyclase (GGDEF)-like protein